MKQIEIDNIEKYNRFVTRGGKPANLLNYVPESNEKNRLIFIVEKNIIMTSETGICYTVNGYSTEYCGSSFNNFDVFVDDIQIGWINLYKLESDQTFVGECSDKIFQTRELAVKNAIAPILKTIKIEFSI